MYASKIMGPRLVIPGVVVGCTVLVAFLIHITAQASYPPPPVKLKAGSLLLSSDGAVGRTSQIHTEELPPGNASEASSEYVGMVGQECAVSDRFPAKVLRWCEWITQYAQKRGLSPDLIAALILQESAGDHMAYSRSGAVGLMQVMPRDGLAASFTCINGPCFSDRPTTEELQDPEFNISYGTRMLSNLLARSGDIREALKAYGPMNVGYYYADKVLGLLHVYGGAAGSGAASSGVN